jgi:hypothetical protein
LLNISRAFQTLPEPSRLKEQRKKELMWPKVTAAKTLGRER